MGQKVRPTGFRTGIVKDWSSRWYANKQDFGDLLIEDFKLRAFVKNRYRRSGISRTEIERTREKVVVYIYSARVGMIIGKKGQEAVESEMKAVRDLSERLRARLTAMAAADVAAFDGLMAAYRLPKASETEKQSRAAAIQDNLRAATETPLECARACAHGWFAAPWGNRSAS